MALVPRKVIARLVSVSGGDPAELSWEWILRADGRVYCRLTGIDGRWERKQWTPVVRLPAGEMPTLRGVPARAVALLGELARERGHQAALP
jgi:hypothetical protein